MRYDHFNMLPDRAFLKVAGRMTYEGSGGDTAPAPDYTPMANASAEGARLGKELGDAQLAESRRQYENNMAVAAPVVQAQLGIMSSQQAQGNDYYDYQKNTFRPVEEGLVKDANEFSTAGAQEQFARSAAADLQSQQANQVAQNNRAMSAMGVNPNSAKFQALAGQQGLASAAARAGATTNARVQADSLGFAKRMDVAGLGRGLTGASQGSYGLAVNAGNSAVGNNAQAGNSLINGMSASNGTAMQGSSQNIAGLGNILNSQTSMYNASQPTDNTGAIIGAVGGIAAAAMMCDIRLKRDISPLATLPNGLVLYAFRYVSSNDWVTGFMAQEVKQMYPEAVFTRDDGYLGLDLAALASAIRAGNA